MAMQATVLDVEYKKLWESGTTTGQLKQVKEQKQCWVMQCFMDEGCRKEHSKADVEYFVRMVARGYNISFYRPRVCSDSEFWVRFLSEVL